jgi:hypothetical protein
MGMSWGVEGGRRPIARRGSRCAALLIAALCVAALPWGSASAIEMADSLRQGQYLVDLATRQIDGRTASLMASAADRALLFREVRGLLAWEQDYASERIGPRYPLTGPQGLLVRDGVADTLVTRLHAPLQAYVQAHPEELLTAGRQAFELALSSIPMPPGRFLGFHFVQLAGLYGAQCDTILAAVERTHRGDVEGVQDGYLRQLWDMSQLYQQAHATSGEKYLCTVSQEDWMAERLVCPVCGRRGMRLTDQRMALREDTSAECRQFLASQTDDHATRIAKLLCRRWGHIFDARCQKSDCTGAYDFSVPLPYYRKMMLEIERGEAQAPDMQERVRKM